METKQVIILRKDLNMRKGKMVAQGAHASVKVITDRIKLQLHGIHEFYPTAQIEKWLKGSFTKICVGVDSKDELLEIYQKAKEAGILCSLILDAGKTEFNEPTYTAVALGPDYTSKIDKLTGHLKLL